MGVHSGAWWTGRGLLGLTLAFGVSRPPPGRAEAPASLAVRNWFGADHAWIVHGTYHTVETELSLDHAEEFVRRLDAAYLQWCDAWQRRPATNDRIIARVFTSGAAYTRAAGELGVPPELAGKSRGLCVPAAGVVLVNSPLGEVLSYRERLAPPPRGAPAAVLARRNARLDHAEARAIQRTLRTLYHEVVHAYLAQDRAGGDAQARYPRWIHEGFAEYFATGGADTDPARRSRAHRRLLARLQSAISLGQTISLATLLATEDPAAFQYQHPAAHYWGLIWYLEHTGVIRDHGGWNQFLAAAVPDRTSAFERAVGQPLPRFERIWHRYMKNLSVGQHADR